MAATGIATPSHRAESNQPKPLATLAWLKSHAPSLSITILLIALAMYAFFRSPLAQWQHSFLQHTVAPQQPVDAILVLGYAVDHNAGVVTAPLAARLEQAYQLLRRNVSSSVIFTGGCSWSKRDELPSEAAVMAKWMEARWKGKQLPQTADAPQLQPSPSSADLPQFILEEQSTSTWTNAINCLGLLSAHYPHITSLLLVTNRFHQWRTYAVFQRAIREHTRADADSAGGGEWSAGMSGMAVDVMDDRVTQWDFWRELAAIVYYKIRGYI